MSFETILSNYPESIFLLAYELRDYLVSHLPDIREYTDEKAKVIGFGYGEGYKDQICTMILSKKEIKLGFYKGSELPDSGALLTGTGKVHKYVPIRSADDLKNPFLKQLLKEALIAYQKRKT